MELIDMSVSARNVFGGSVGFDVEAGKTVKIETSPNGTDILNEKVPANERWRIQLNIQIEKFVV